MKLLQSRKARGFESRPGQYEDLVMDGVGAPLDLTMFYSDADAEAAGGNGGGFVIEDVAFRRITSTNSHYEGSFLCSADQPCRKLTLEDVTFDVKKWKCHGKSGCDCFTDVTQSKAVGVTPDIAECVK